MFSTIFKYELRFWFRQPSIYIYSIIFFLLGMLMMADDAGVWLEYPKDFIANSPMQIQDKINWFTRFILILLPTILGRAIYRDIKSEMYSLLYVYPMTKMSYLLAKFSSAFLVLMISLSFIAFGLIAGTALPNAKAEMLTAFDVVPYLQSYFIFIIPNLLFLGSIVFGVVALTRNIYAGFITIAVLYIFQMLIGSLTGNVENEFAMALSDPTGAMSLQYYITSWSPVEMSKNYIPIEKAIILNRVIWLSVAILVFAFTYFKFKFSQQTVSFFNFKTFKSKEESVKTIKKQLGTITKINLSKVDYNFSFLQQLKTTWTLSNIEFQYIVTNRMFLILLVSGSLAIFFQLANIQPTDGFELLPTTWKMLSLPMIMFSGIINVLTFLYAGMLVHRARTANMNQLIDTNPISNWSLMLAQFLALIKMQTALLCIVMIGGLSAQLYNGYYDFEIGHYLFELFVLHLVVFVIWAMVSIFIQSVFNNAYLGLFLLVMGSMGMFALPQFGVEPAVFRYNTGPSFDYSDLHGYDSSLFAYLAYKAYWLIFGTFLILGTLLFWTRGLTFSFGERFRLALSRIWSKTGVVMASLLVVFVCFGFNLYHNEYLANGGGFSKEDEREAMKTYEKRYSKFKNTPQPKIVSVKTNMDIFPSELRFEATGEYILVNKTNTIVDTLIVRTGFDEVTTYEFDQTVVEISKDDDFKLSVWKLEMPLQPNDSLQLTFKMKNPENTAFKKYPNVKTNGSFIGRDAFPRIGFVPTGKKDLPSDSTNHQTSYMSYDADWIDFEATMSTSSDQIALAPGYLQKEWTANGRNYFHYKMNAPIKFYFGFNSGKYEVLRDSLNGVSLEIYHQKGHDYNTNRMLDGLKGTLKYCNKNFSKYQHEQARIIEYPKTLGMSSTTFANSIPFEEYLFLADIRESEDDIDMPFYVAAHELAHQWWGNQVIPADVLGAKMLTESLAEYTALKVLEQHYGKDLMRKFLKMDLDSYLKNRRYEYNEEFPLMRATAGQEYVNYRKGALVFYALSDYLGEEKLNNILSKFIEKTKYRVPYTTSIELIDMIKAATPDSLQYVITDMFETVTFYNNHVQNATVTALDNGKFQVDFNPNISKYRLTGKKSRRIYEDENGKTISFNNPNLTKPIQSLPLADYIEIGILDIKGNYLYLKKHQFTEINNDFSIIVDERPFQIGIDPNHMLIEISPRDNYIKIQ